MLGTGDRNSKVAPTTPKRGKIYSNKMDVVGIARVVGFRKGRRGIWVVFSSSAVVDDRRTSNFDIKRYRYPILPYLTQPHPPHPIPLLHPLQCRNRASSTRCPSLMSRPCSTPSAGKGSKRSMLARSGAHSFEIRRWTLINWNGSRICRESDRTVAKGFPVDHVPGARANRGIGWKYHQVDDSTPRREHYRIRHHAIRSYRPTILPRTGEAKEEVTEAVATGDVACAECGNDGTPGRSGDQQYYSGP